MPWGPLAHVTSKLGPGLKFVLAAIAVVGLLEALLTHWMGMIETWEALACIPDEVLRGQIWRLVTSGFLTDITHPMGLVFTLVGLYFLSPDLERRWGTGRFLWFLAACVALGNVLSIAVDWLAPERFPLLHPHLLYGADAALVGTAIAWGFSHRDDQILFFMVLPMRGITLVWVTVLFCFLYLLYMGDVAGFGGVGAAMVMVGQPSMLRRALLRVKLALLRTRQGKVPTARDILRAKEPILKKGRGGDRPPLRVVQGGQPDLEGDLGKRDPSKDKRYLN